MTMKRLIALMVSALLLAVALGASPVYPKIIELPDGFFPEGIGPQSKHRSTSVNR